jgi:hypothetical protein
MPQVPRLQRDRDGPRGQSIHFVAARPAPSAAREDEIAEELPIPQMGTIEIEPACGQGHGAGIETTRFEGAFQYRPVPTGIIGDDSHAGHGNYEKD